ncbi:MAG: hypothetical protein KKA79_03105, partial [Nanoarchaeota archaeon]|nr:hypothetical protein [Nanoarchaeota archaeon]
MLYLENTDERRIIETLYEKFTEDLIVSDLAKYGVIVLPTPVLVDCAANACNQLSLPANPNTIETICREENII